MGTCRDFGTGTCPKCHRHSNAGEFYPCPHCFEAYWTKRLERELLPRQLRSLGFSESMASFFFLNKVQIFRAKLYWNVLLGRGSPLRRFTYYHNGTPGSITRNEDILDHIISFLV
jgi:hypothetical protein